MALFMTVFKVWECSRAEVVCIFPHLGLCTLDTGQPKEPQLFYELCFGAGLLYTIYVYSMGNVLSTVCVL